MSANLTGKQSHLANSDTPLRTMLNWSSSSLSVLISSVGILIALKSLTQGIHHFSVALFLPFSPLQFSGDATSGLFALLVSGVGLAGGAFSIGYLQRAHLGVISVVLQPIFLATMILVPFAESAPTFLLLWELMAVESFALVMSYHRRESTRSAGALYAVMTQLGFVAIAFSLVLLAAKTHTLNFSTMAVRASTLSGSTRSMIFIFSFMGFASKAGLAPLHAWLPRAHPEAPSPVSALMSAAMVGLGVYGIIRIDMMILGPGPTWWALILTAVGATSALYGSLQASTSTDLKVLLAYSTSEHIGIITLALGISMLLRSNAALFAAQAALAAALFHLVAHATFKSLGFFCAGAIQTATGTTDLDLLGGLGKKMASTGGFLAISALSAASLPLGSGFVGEWMLLQALVHAPLSNGATTLVFPLALSALALASGVGVLTMVKAFGFSILARPRSAGAEQGRRVPMAMITAMAIMGISTIVLGIAPGAIGWIIQAVLAQQITQVGSSPAQVPFSLVLSLFANKGSISPIVAGLTIAAGVVSIALVAKLGSRRRPPEIVTPIWGCGASALNSRTQYTASSFAQPLQHVFSDLLQPNEHLQSTTYDESEYILKSVQYRYEQPDSIEQLIHVPLIGAVEKAASVVRSAHNGSINLYLAYGALGFIVVLVTAR